MLLEWLGQKDRKSILVATTNEPEFLDAALMRPGRLDRKIPMMYPDPEARRAILNVHLNIIRKIPHDDLPIDYIIEKTELFSGAEIEALVLKAGRRALKAGADKLEPEHFEGAIASFRLNMSERKKLVDKYLELAATYTDDRAFLESLRKENVAFDRVAAVRDEMDVDP